MPYQIVVDAGSSGSRAYVYQWPSIDPKETTESYLMPLTTKPEWIKRVTPGISSFKGRSSKDIWLEHLKPLIDGVISAIPRNERSNTPVFFLATAGLRLLEKEDRDTILADVCNLLKSKTPLSIGHCNQHVSMIDGETEGLYGWLGLNYLLHTRDDSLWTASEYDQTYGFMDMGGASTQIAFVPNATESERHHDDLYTVSLRTNTGEPLTWKLFVTTWLGFGANQAQSRWRQYLADNATPQDLEALKSDSPVVLQDPCIQSGALYSDTKTINGNEVEVYFHGSGDFPQCEQRLEALLNADKPCKDTPCLFDGRHVPAFDTQVQKFVGVSEYWYSAQDLYHLDGKFDYTSFLGHATEFCQSDWSVVEQKLQNGAYGPNFDEKRLQQGCFKSAWVLTVLHKGFQFTLDPNEPEGDHNFLDTFQSAANVNGLELSWTLGKALMHVSSQIPSTSGNKVGFVSDKGEILTEESSAIIVRSNGPYYEVVVLVLFIALLAWVYRKSADIRKKFAKGWDALNPNDESILPERETRRHWSRPSSRTSTPVYPQFELNDMPSPGMNRSPVFGQFREGMSISSSVPISRAPSRVSSRLNISNMQEQD